MPARKPRRSARLDLGGFWLRPSVELRDRTCLRCRRSAHWLSGQPSRPIWRAVDAEGIGLEAPAAAYDRLGRLHSSRRMLLDNFARLSVGRSTCSTPPPREPSARFSPSCRRSPTGRRTGGRRPVLAVDATVPGSCARRDGGDPAVGGRIAGPLPPPAAGSPCQSWVASRGPPRLDRLGVRGRSELGAAHGRGTLSSTPTATAASCCTTVVAPTKHRGIRVANRTANLVFRFQAERTDIRRA